MHLFAVVCLSEPQSDRVVAFTIAYKDMVKFLRFRTGCHALPNVTRGWEGVPCSQRLCPLCQSQHCDERHAMLECPALVSLRDKYHQLFCGAQFHATVSMAE